MIVGVANVSEETVFLERFDATKRLEVLKVLELARVSWRMRDDDNLYLGRIEASLWDALMEVGEKFEIQTAGYKALDALRIEKGYLYWSGDITPEDNPLEAGLGLFVAKDKPDFIGKKALESIQKKGLASKLAALTMDAGGNLYGGESVYSDGKVIDRIRSGNYGYTIGRDVGLVYLPLELAEEGRELEVQVMGERVKARVADLPLVDPKGEKIKA